MDDDVGRDVTAADVFGLLVVLDVGLLLVLVTVGFVVVTSANVGGMV